MALLKDNRFYELCTILQIQGQIASDPDKKAIEKAFRKAALKTHPDKGGDPVKFRLVNDAYNKLICHVDKLQRMEMEAELRSTSVIIEISKQALPKWWDKLKSQYGAPKTSDVKSTIFQGPYKQYKGRGKLTGPITVILFEDPEDKVPKLLCKCENYMAWIQEQKMPLHLHVNRDKKIMFDQWRIMSLAEFNFANIDPSSSARHDWKSNQDFQSTPRPPRKADPQKEKEEAERKQNEKEEAERKQKEKEEEERQKQAEAEAEKKRKEREDQENKPWWHQYADKYKGFNIGETTPPPDPESYTSPPEKDDGFPKVFNMTSNTFTKGGLAHENSPSKKTEEEEQKEKAAKEEAEKVESEPPKRETKKERRAKLLKAQQEAEARLKQQQQQNEEQEKQKAQTVKPEPAKTEPEPAKTEPEPVPEVPVQQEPTRTEAEQAKPTPMDTEPVEVVQPERVIPNEPRHVDKTPVEIIDIKPVNMSQPEPVEVKQQEPVKPVEIKTAPVIVMEVKPARQSTVEPIVIPEPVVVEEVAEPQPDHEPTCLFSEAELNKKDIGKVTEKLVNKAKIKKIKTKQAVIRKSSISDPGLDMGDSAEEKENREAQHHDEAMLGSKARKRPLEDASLDWTTEGLQTKPEVKDPATEGQTSSEKIATTATSPPNTSTSTTAEKMSSKILEDNAAINSTTTSKEIKTTTTTTTNGFATSTSAQYKPTEQGNKTLARATTATTTEEKKTKIATAEVPTKKVGKTTATATPPVIKTTSATAATAVASRKENYTPTTTATTIESSKTDEARGQPALENVQGGVSASCSESKKETLGPEASKKLPDKGQKMTDNSQYDAPDKNRKKTSENEIYQGKQKERENGDVASQKTDPAKDSKAEKILFNLQTNGLCKFDLQREKSIPPKHLSNITEEIHQHDASNSKQIPIAHQNTDNRNEMLSAAEVLSTSKQQQEQQQQQQKQQHHIAIHLIGNSPSKTRLNIDLVPNHKISDDVITSPTLSNDEEDSWDEDSIPPSRARSSLSVSRGETQPNLSPYSNDYHESARRYSSTENVPSRWRRGSNFSILNSIQPQQSRYAGSSRSSMTREEPTDGVLRSKSVHLLCREPSPRSDNSPRTSREPSYIHDSQRNFSSPPPSRDRRAYSVLSYPPPPPPAVPPPPLPSTPHSTPYVERKYRSTENVRREDRMKTPTLSSDQYSVPKTTFSRPSEFKSSYATLRNATTSQVGNNTDRNTDRIPSRFRRARDHAAAASNPDISKKHQEYSAFSRSFDKSPEFSSTSSTKNADFHEQIRLARIEHQLRCDEAKKFDPKKNFLTTRSKSVTLGSIGGTGRATPVGSLKSVPASPAGESSLRRGSTRFAF